MSDLRDPPRLLDEPGGVPSGLREAWRALPSPLQTQAVVDGLGHTSMQKASIGSRAFGAKALFAKWVGIAALGALCTYGLMHANTRLGQPRTRESGADARSTTDMRQPSLDVASAAPSSPPKPTIRALAEVAYAGATDEDEQAIRGSAPEPIDVARQAAHAVREASHSERARGATDSAAASLHPPATGATQPSRTRAGVSVAKEGARATREPEPDDELALIRAAQAALVKHPARALAMLQRHALLLPRGAFAEERDVLMLDALHALGRRAELDGQARAFLRAFPGSMHQARVRGYLPPESP